eukprot:6210962-Pleurochrysis_carterae.AAC.2
MDPLTFAEAKEKLGPSPGYPRDESNSTIILGRGGLAVVTFCLVLPVVERLGPRLEEMRGLRLFLSLSERNVRSLLHAVFGRQGADAVEFGRVEARSLDIGELDDLRRDLEHCGVPEGFAGGGCEGDSLARSVVLCFKVPPREMGGVGVAVKANTREGYVEFKLLHIMLAFLLHNFGVANACAYQACFE